MASEKFFTLQLPDSDASSIKTVFESIRRDVGVRVVLFGPTDDAGQFSFVVHPLDGDEIDTKAIMNRVKEQALIYWPELKGNKTGPEESDKHASICPPASGGQFDVSDKNEPSDTFHQSSDGGPRTISLTDFTVTDWSGLSFRTRGDWKRVVNDMNASQSKKHQSFSKREPRMGLGQPASCHSLFVVDETIQSRQRPVFHSCTLCDSVPLRQMLEHPEQEYELFNQEDGTCTEPCQLYEAISEQLRQLEDVTSPPAPKQRRVSVVPSTKPRSVKALVKAVRYSFGASTDSSRLDLMQLSAASGSQPSSLQSCSPCISDNLAAPEDAKGLSILADPRSPGYFMLLHHWLDVCDRYHQHSLPLASNLPNRVIDVGTSDDPNRLRLVAPNNDLTQGCYVALSHRWTDGSKDCQTTTKNINERLQSIDFKTLTETFQDAITVTRQLGIQYLWIDSLCIVQDDKIEWLEESKRMEYTYSMAYVTLAVTPADYRDGFLRRSPTHFSRLGDEKFFGVLSRTGANFVRDVEEGDLSTRGWILQERALSRRSIHFTEAQIYFECGSCIWCETGEPIEYDTLHTVPLVFYWAWPLSRSQVRLTRTHSYRAPLSSSYFPLSERSNRPAECSRIFKDLFRRYSKMDLTNAKDRPLAIAGLEYRLSQVYNTDVIYGMLRSHFAESLFWQRSGSSWLQAQIKMADWPLHVGSLPLPTWSWTAYKGEITYIDCPLRSIIWSNDLQLRAFRGLEHCMLYTPLGTVRVGSSSRMCGDNSTKVWNAWQLVGKVWFDAGPPSRDDVLKCVKLGEDAPGRLKGEGMSWLEGLPSRDLTFVMMTAKFTVDDRVFWYRVGVGVFKTDYVGFGEENEWVI